MFIKDQSTLVKTIFGPMLFIYINDLYNLSLKRDILKFVHVSRDGLIISRLIRLYQSLRLYGRSSLSELPTKHIYLLSSRRSAIIINLKSSDDIRNSFRNHRFTGTLRECLKKRFNINTLSSSSNLDNYFDTNESLESLIDSLNPFSDEILENAVKERNNYLTYLRKLKINLEGQFLLTDIGINGSSQKCLSNLLKNDEIVGSYL